MEQLIKEMQNQEIWLGLGALIVLAWASRFFVKKIIIKFINNLTKRSKSSWDDELVKEGVFDQLAQVAPALVVYFFASEVVSQSNSLSELVARIAFAYIVIIIANVTNKAINVCVRISQSSKALAGKPVNSWGQVLKIIVWTFAGIVAVGTLADRSPWALLGGLSALTAVLMLVFKDSILGFVASIQISALNLVRLGDWIEVPKYKADGDVIEISLNTIRVQNWDKTITSMPTYALISDGFKNWRGMSESGGRRIKRALNIDLNSIMFLNKNEITRLKSIQSLRPYLDLKEEEVDGWNEKNKADASSIANGRQLTNIGTFRAYLKAWLKENPNINKDMTFLVRQLASSEIGLPIEIYIFSAQKNWVEYEEIVADIFDHIFAVLPEFKLRPYQRPSGHDFNNQVDL